MVSGAVAPRCAEQGLVSMSNAAAAEATIAHLDEMGRFEAVDAALREAVLSLARAVDQQPQNAPLWRQYRDALADLLRVDDDIDDGLAEALAALRSSTPVGDPQAP